MKRMMLGVAGVFLAASACSSGIKDGYYWSEGTAIYKVTSTGDQVALEVQQLGVRPGSQTFAVTKQGEVLTGSHPLIGTFSIGKNDPGIHVVGLSTAEVNAGRTTPQTKTPASTEARAAQALSVLQAELKECAAEEHCGKELSADERLLLTTWGAQLRVEKSSAGAETVQGPVHSTPLTLTVNAGPVESATLALEAKSFDVDVRVDAFDFAEATSERVQLLRFNGDGGRNSTNGEWVPYIASETLLGSYRSSRGLAKPKAVAK